MPRTFVILCVGLALALMLLLGLARYAGIPVTAIPQTPTVAAGLAAKLACSAHYLSGFSEPQTAEDIRIFSPALELAALDFSAPQQVSASVLGATATARFYPGLGCTLQRPAMFPLDSLTLASHSRAETLVAGPGPDNDALQLALESVLTEDEASGLDTRALLVVRGGRVLAEAYGTDTGPDTPLLGWSMGKSLTALIVGRMQALGILSQGMTGLFPEWGEDERSAISLEQLLQMSSGLAFSEPYLPGNDSTRMLFNASNASAVALEKPLEHAPGTHFAYSSGTTNLLCRLIGERLGGPQGFVSFFDREVAAPLGLRNTVVELDPSGYCVGSSFVYASARDWARMALPLMQAGRAGGQQWLSPGWVRRAVTPNGSDNNPRYGYQLWLNSGGDGLHWPDLPADAFAMSGHNGQVVMIIPSLDAIFVRLGWTAGDYPVNTRVSALASHL